MDTFAPFHGTDTMPRQTKIKASGTFIVPQSHRLQAIPARIKVPDTFFLVLIALWLSSCGPTAFEDPLARMMDRNASMSIRFKAARQLERESPDDPKRIAALRELVWIKYQPTELRCYAIDELIEHDEAEARQFLSRRLMIVNDWKTYDHIHKIVEERNWTDFTPGLVRRYAIQVGFIDDLKRPERELIAALNPNQEVEAVILRVFADPDYAKRIETRAAAWALLNRLVDREKLMAMLMELQTQEPLVLDLQAGARELHVTADSMETITWLRVLRTEEHREFWAKARAAVARLNAEQRKGLKLRHLGLLARLYETNDPMLGKSRADLMRQLSGFVSAQQHYYKGPTFDGPMDSVPQRLYEWRDELCWGDLAVMNAITRTFGDPATIAEWFQQAEADMRDEISEHGGLLRWDERGELAAVAYRPQFRKHDLAYYATKQMILDAYTALAHYHFHAQKYRNVDYAGPGMGDQKRIGGIQRFNGLVLTFISENKLNVDYYCGRKVIVDLGSIHR